MEFFSPLHKEGLYDWIRAVTTAAATTWLVFGTVDQLVATSVGFACEEVKFYHHPLRAFFRQEGVRALSVFTFLYWGVWYPHCKRAWVTSFGITLLAIVVCTTHLLQTVIKVHESESDVLKAMQFSHVALILTFGFSAAIENTLRRPLLWRIAGVVVAALPSLSMLYEGQFSYDLRDFAWSAKPFFLFWLTAAVISNWRPSVRPNGQ